MPRPREHASNTPSTVTFMRFETPTALTPRQFLEKTAQTRRAYTRTWLIQQEGRPPSDYFTYREQGGTHFEEQTGLKIISPSVQEMEMQPDQPATVELQAPVDTHPRVYAAASRRIKRIWNLSDE